MIDDDAAWEHWRGCWKLRGDTVYLNHGSFGPPPEPVRAARRSWIDRLDAQPMDFFLRQLEPELSAARERLATFVGTGRENIVFVENATAAMNVVAGSVQLSPGDDVLLTDHEYDAVYRIWKRRCAGAGTAELHVVKLPMPMQSSEQIVDTIFAALGKRTRLIVVSHVTSKTAAILPVGAICARAHQRGVAVCVDGPHAPAQVPLDIDSLGCDFYTASLHKWLSAPFGSGFLYVHPRHQDRIQTNVLSWGRLPPAKPESWDDEFTWTGTRDPSAYLSVPVAIDFLESVGLDAFRARTHDLAQFARERLIETTGGEAIVPDNEQWYGSMALVSLPPGDSLSLQIALWERFGIEVPIIDFAGRRYIRVSCHLYNDRQQIDLLCEALGKLI